MGRRSPRRKEELESRYGNGAFAPIESEFIKKAKMLSAKYILFANKDNKHGVCEKCGKDVEFEYTKHKQKITCPNCKMELEVRHTWRGKCVWDIDWFVVGDVVDKETFALRYISVEQNNDYTKNIKESAREIYDYNHGWSYRFSFVDGKFCVDNGYYFQEFLMGGFRRKQCCIGAETIDNIRAKVRTLDAFKYFDKFDEYFNTYVYPRDNIKQLLSVSLYEKLEKIGLKEIAKYDYNNYWKPMKYKRNETELTKMIGINKQQLRILKKDDSVYTLNFIKKYKKMSLNILEYLIDNHMTNVYDLAIQANNPKPLKTTRYICNNKMTWWDYNHHLGMMQKLGYKLDENYRYPKDFAKEHQRVIEEYNAMLDEEMIKEMDEQSILIKKISDGLRKMPDLKDFLNGSNGLLVYVPESARDLITEGRRLHNCIGNYVDRVAEEKTLVFFVRRLNAPNDPFVAFEYCNGEVIQCRYDNNKKVDDDKIINFVDAFAKCLRDNNVMCKAA